MSDSLYQQYGRPLIKVAVMFLAGLSVAGAYVQIQTFGVAGIPDAIVSLYIAGLILWGVFWEGFQTFRFRVLLYAGVILWGTTGLIQDPGNTLSAILVIGGSLLLARVGYKEYERRNKPVYKR